jgi:hypothetical protein
LGLCRQFAAGCGDFKQRCKHAALYQLLDQAAFAKCLIDIEKILAGFDPSGFARLSFLQHTNAMRVYFFLMAQGTSPAPRKR